MRSIPALNVADIGLRVAGKQSRVSFSAVGILDAGRDGRSPVATATRPKAVVFSLAASVPFAISLGVALALCLQRRWCIAAETLRREGVEF